ncbi:hypothetical protein KA025_02645 [Candidatus Saccharibacteria bacterium]|nr:hypothetical protein [Candidatus Saccharibacteria bacterium]MBP7834963.1 hypothetical protein [Candidatus Saccharibacteria bacterium]
MSVYAAKNAIFTSEKAKYIGQALIDDNPQIPNCEIASWKHIVFDQPYNQHSKSQLRIYDWNKSNLLNILSTIRIDRME